jgi:hypothetical protein
MNYHRVCIHIQFLPGVYHKALITTGVGNAAAVRRTNELHGLTCGNRTGTKAGGVKNAAWGEGSQRTKVAWNILWRVRE